MKKGFTLIELLAVIVIIGLITVLIVPKVQTIIKDSKKSTYEASTHALIREADSFYIMKKSEMTPFTGCSYNFTTKTNTCIDFEFTGKEPNSGKIQIKEDGTVALAVQFGDNCYLKAFDTEQITTQIYDSSTCGENAEVFTNYELPEIVTTGDGLYESKTEPGRYIYRGETPKNYIYINEGTEETPDNVLYRIISFESDGTIKVVRNESIGNIAWDEVGNRNEETDTYCSNASSFGCNVWGNETTTLYQDTPIDELTRDFYFEYYASKDDTSLTTQSGGTVTVEASLNTYLNPTDEDQTSKWGSALNLYKYIKEHDFNVGGIYYTTSYLESKGIIKEKEEESQFTLNGKIGLMNITEFVEASTNDGCSLWENAVFNPKYYYMDEGETTKSVHAPTEGWPCKVNNWTMNSDHQWSLSAYSSYNYSQWIAVSDGYFSNSGVYDTNYGVRPTFYLKSSIRLGGSGINSDPYYIID